MRPLRQERRFKIREVLMEENLISEAVENNNTPEQVTVPKSFSQEEVNRIAAQRAARAAESVRREYEQRQKQELEALEAKRAEHVAQTSREVDADVLYQQVQERFNREMQERQLKDQMTQVANNYLSKVAQAKNNYDDFEEVTKDFDPTAFPQLTFLLSGIENAGDILYDLSKNPMKLAGIDRLAERNPKLAQAELLKLSRSINENRQALAEAQMQNVLEPLDRLNPSRVSTNNGKMSIRDLRNQPWLRG